HKHKFIFFHGRKTAGSSIGISLMRFLGPDDVVRGYITGGLAEGVVPPGYYDTWKYLGVRHNAPAFLDYLKHGCRLPVRVFQYRRYAKLRFGIRSTHTTCAALRELLPSEVWDSYFKFTFVRNPWDRMISFYHWRTANMSAPPSFTDFVGAIHADDHNAMLRYNAVGFDLTPFYKINGKRCVDFVARFEHLQNDLYEVSRAIGLPFDGWLPENKSQVRRKAEGVQHSPETARMVAEIAREEIADLGYEYHLADVE
ncbi:MAG: sulfotransferase family 2 domain-containing protein, partial [Spirochaetales bacterium]